MTVMLETSLPSARRGSAQGGNLFARGKVRDTYDLPALLSGGAALAREASRLRRCMVMRMIRIGRSE